MLARQGSMTAQAGRRRAGVTLWALFSLTTMLVALALAVNTSWLSTATQELRSATDAASLAAARELVSDEWLKPGRPGIASLLADARVRAARYAALNRVLGQPLQLTLHDSQQSDIVFGSRSANGSFVVADASRVSTWTLDQCDAVAVTGRRVRSRGTAVPVLLGALVFRPTVDLETTIVSYLDRDVIGFRATPGNPIPMVPIGIRSDATGADPASWEHQILHQQGHDAFQLDSRRTAVFGRDGLPEMDITFEVTEGTTTAAHVAQPRNGTVLTIGRGTPTEQVCNGISCNDLANQASQLCLGGAKHTLTVSCLGSKSATPRSVLRSQLSNALKQLQQSGEARVWPLVSEVNSQEGQATIRAFVAARVVRIEETAEESLRVRLQPAMLAVPQALTDATRRGTGHLLPNPYLARVRLGR